MLNSILNQLNQLSSEELKTLNKAVVEKLKVGLLQLQKVLLYMKVKKLKSTIQVIEVKSS